jgi:hypothetical protein
MNCNGNDTRPRAMQWEPGAVHADARPLYTVSARYADGWWTVHVPESIGITARVRFLDDVEAHARRAIAVVRHVPEDSFDVVVEVQDRPSPA